MPAFESEPSPAHDSSVTPQHLRPLFVDLDGTLIASDSLWDSVAIAFRIAPVAALGHFIAGLWGTVTRGSMGKAGLKERFATHFPIGPEELPLREEVVAFLADQKKAGRSLVLASAANHRIVERVAGRLALFDATIGSTATTNCNGQEKLNAIQAHLTATGKRGQEFAYMGNARADDQIWDAAAEVLAVGNNGFCDEVRTRYRQKPVHCFESHAKSMPALFRLLRPHQWAKNLLLFLPVLASHNLQWSIWMQVLLGAIAFSLIASATYVINDVLDLQADRLHPRKRTRPLASGAIGLPTALFAAALLGAAGLLLATALSAPFLLATLVYVATTLLYSLWLKRQSIVDVIVLAGLYTLRVLAGGLAAGIAVSNWLLALSIFLFLSLALIKRCAELLDAKETGKLKAAGRGYHIEDIATLRSIGITSGFIAVLVLALYIDRPQVAALYAHPTVLWLTLPILAGWLMRLWIETARGNMHDDPLVYAFEDRVSQVVGLGLALVALVASGKWLS